MSLPVRFNEKYFEKLKIKNIFNIKFKFSSNSSNDQGLVQNIDVVNSAKLQNICKNLILGCGGLEINIIMNKQISKIIFLKINPDIIGWNILITCCNFVGEKSNLKSL